MMPLSLYSNGFGRLASTLAQDVLGRPRPDCCATDPSCGSGRPILVTGRDVRDVADRVHTGEALDGQVGEDVETAARPGAGPAFCATAEPDSPPPHTTVRAGIVLPSSNSTWSA